MQIKINEKTFEIDDSKELNISFKGDLEGLSVNESQSETITRGNRVINQRGGVYLERGNIINHGQYSENGNTSISQGLLINIEGNINHVETENGNISITGEAKDIKTHNGNVSTTGNVVGDIKTHNGNVKVMGGVTGNVETHNGDIKTGK